MQGKGLVKFLVIIVTLACLYSLSFTFVTRKVERDAKAYANGDMALEKAYLDSIAGEVVYNIGIAKYTYREAKGNEIALGLDLKGGINVTMEVSLQELVRNLANNPKDENFNAALVNAETRSKSSQSTYVRLFVEEFKKLSPSTPLDQSKPIAPTIKSKASLKKKLAMQLTTLSKSCVRVLINLG
jgi:SecD/SecF fusion protein